MKGSRSAGRRSNRSLTGVLFRLALLCACPLLAGPGSLLASGAPHTPTWAIAVGLVSLLSLAAVAADAAGLLSCHFGIACPALFLIQLGVLVLMSASAAPGGELGLIVDGAKPAVETAGVTAAVAAAPAALVQAPPAQSLGTGHLAGSVTGGFVAVTGGSGAQADDYPPVPGHSGRSQLSVVLACADENEYAINTAKKVFERTPQGLLKEIVIVDDGSSSPMTTVFDQAGLDEKARAEKKIKIIRHPQTMGLMVAKKTGGDAAIGDIIVFFDCHVSPQPNWHQPIIDLIEENPRRMVVPGITDLDIDTWEEKQNSAVNTKCYLTWQAEFDWFEDDDPYVPVMSGGLLALSRYWWHVTGGYDGDMRGWGGENLDQSLRSWLCGGEIMRAASSRVAHMWRVTSDMRTRVRYRGVGSAGTNKLRVVVAWYGVFRVKYDGNENTGSNLDTSSIKKVQERLKCKPLVHFLHRFRDVYVAGAVIPRKVFQLKHSTSGMCLTKLGNSITIGGCRNGGAKGDESQLFHWANRLKSKGPNGQYNCCSGLRHWTSDACLDYADSDSGAVHTYPCDVTGGNGNQQYHFDEGWVRHTSDGRCLVPQNNLAVLKQCHGLTEKEAAWEEINSFEPIESRLYKEQLQVEGLLDPAYPQ